MNRGYAEESYTDCTCGIIYYLGYVASFTAVCGIRRKGAHAFDMTYDLSNSFFFYTSLSIETRRCTVTLTAWLHPSDSSAGGCLPLFWGVGPGVFNSSLEHRLHSCTATRGCAGHEHGYTFVQWAVGCNTVDTYVRPHESSTPFEYPDSACTPGFPRSWKIFTGGGRSPS